MGLSAEPGRVGGVGRVQGGGTWGADLDRGVAVHRCGGVQADAAVPVLVVVLAEERDTEPAGVGDGPEPVGKGRAVLLPAPRG